MDNKTLWFLLLRLSMQIEIAGMNRIPKLALINLNNHNLFHFKTALFHSTHARKVDPRRRTHWDPKPYKRPKNVKHELLRKAESGYAEYGPFFKNESSRHRNHNGWAEEFFRAKDDSKRARSQARSQARKKGFFSEDEDEEEYGPTYESPRNSEAHYKYKRASWFDGGKEEAHDEYGQSSYKSHTSSESKILNTDLSKDRIALGLSGSGPLSLEHVKKAYRDCALKWHPDRHDGSSKAIAEEKFKACNSAYQSLCDKLGPD